MDNNKFITSRQNKIIKTTFSLKTRKGREKEGMFILEGKRLISEIPKDTQTLYTISSLSYADENADIIIPDKLFAEISETVNPQGIMCICKIARKSFDIKTLPPSPLVVILENVTDPGNMGTIIRTADAAGADALILSKGCTDIYSPKVVRSTMGSLFHIPIYTGTDIEETLTLLRQNNISTLAADLSATQTPYDADMSKGCAIVIGNEANGLKKETSAMCEKKIKIPMPGKAESMNAAVAAAILIYEAVRQRS